VIPLITLHKYPYLPELGYSIIIKVTAINAYGSSVTSLPGNGGIMVLIMDPPVNL